MPRRKQWFPVSLDINDDGDVWELTDECGDRALRVLLEYYRILDKTENKFTDTEKCWLGIFRKCRVYPKNGWKIRDKLLENRWLMVCQGFSGGFPLFCGSPNYWKYHGLQEPEGIAWSALLTKPNQNYSSYKNTQSPDSASPVLKNTEKKKGDFGMSRSMNLSQELKAAGDDVYLSNPEKFKRLAAWIGQGRKHGYSEPDMAEALRRFKAGHYDLIDEWYPYLDTILQKVVGDRNAKESIAEHERFKQEEQDFLKNEKPVLSLVKGVADAKGVK